jgi:hypothetical protein
MRPTVTSYERPCEQCGPERRSMGRKERHCDKTKAHWVIAVSAISPPPYRSRIPICRSADGHPGRAPPDDRLPWISEPEVRSITLIPSVLPMVRS